MKYSYYPGCTLKTKAKELDVYARKCAEKLGVELTEVDDWQCCGGVYTTSRDEIVTKLSSVRALNNAKERGQSLVTVCSACHNVIKRVNYDMANDAFVNAGANNYLQLATPYNGETKVIHFLELLRDEIGFENVKKAVVNPVKRRISAYYGCLLLRPGNVMAMDDPENPRIMEDFISAIGGTPVVSPYRNECCGAYLAVTDPAVPARHCGYITDSFKAKGAETVITACPLCMYNLKRNSGDLPVVYFSEILAEALGVK
ncbi:MAG: CoB--CoM heterodisulfide reductase iron-sulfur subunit B family protein [Clostridia bacterium]|nr:CoB--CoM heterodisulfide reductase iron-sulfur subunit B family protein [Clostridia bacterium]